MENNKQDVLTPDVETLTEEAPAPQVVPEDAELVEPENTDVATPEEPEVYIPEQPMEVHPKKKACGCFWKRLISAVLVVALVAVGCVATGWYLNVNWEKAMAAQSADYQQRIDALNKRLDEEPPVQNTTIVLPDGTPVEGDLTPEQVYAMNVDAVVAISSNQGLTTNIFGQVSQTASSGTGFIISADGYVVTNYHVVQGASTLKVITSDGKEYDAKLVGYEASNDIAVLKIEGQDLPCTVLGNSDPLVVGSQVAAIGNPLGELTSTLTMGYISAKNRVVTTDGTALNMMQTDAAINSGNSGGPLFNMRGEVVGITTAKYSGTSNSGATIEGIGFAIPIDDVRPLIDDIIEFGHVKTGYLGVVVQDVPAEDSQKYGLPMGALILEVTEGSCAMRAGLQPGDIIVDIGGNTVSSIADLTKVLRLYEAGQEATITVYRAGARVETSATFDEKPRDTATQTPSASPEQTPSDGNSGLWPFFP